MTLAIAILTQRQNENTDQKEWALVSRKVLSKIFKWFGTEKPSDEAVLKEERRVQFFRHGGKALVQVIAELVERGEEELADELTASEALYAFMGWLTTRDEVETFSAKHDSAPAADLIKTFMDHYHLPQPEGRWDDKLSAIQAQQSASKCMGCDDPPELECIWADGRGRAWHCKKCFHKWKGQEGGRDIVSVKEVKDGKVGKKWADNKSPNIQKKVNAMSKAKIIAKLVEAGHEDLAEQLIYAGKTFFPAPTEVQKVDILGVPLQFEKSEKTGFWTAWSLDKNVGKPGMPIALPPEDDFEKAKKHAKKFVKDILRR